MKYLWKKWVMHMKISRKDFTGTGKVYGFTLSQMLKGPANMIMLIIMLLFAAASIPVMALLMGGEKTTSSDITNVYVKNDTGYELNLAEIPIKNETFADTSFTETTEEMKVEDIGPTEVYLHLKRNVVSFEIEAVTAEIRDFSGQELSQCTEAFSTLLDEARYAQQEATPQQIAVLTGGYSVHTSSVSEFLQGGEDNFDARFGVQMVYSIIVLMLCTFVSAYIIQKVIEEKASKLAELLMVSVRPLAMLLGKILAVMTYVFGLIAVLIAAMGISCVITGRFIDISVITGQFAAMEINSESFRLSPLAVLVLLASVLLGYLLVSLLSGLIGTGCSSMEDVEPANMAVVMLVMIGYLAAVIAVAVDTPVVNTAVILLPVVSIFCAPTYYIMGSAGIGMVVLSWLIQLAVIALLAYVCAKVYRDLMMYRGSRLKLGGWIAMLGGKRTKEAQ
ncbi:ABC transporter permease [Marvinbryantia formatexigens]|nr:ABC transporter permease [Marvinbryantia formatexigens]UWO26683.1 ABC transporter permease [Marvinbryantia formatexigens DSM 14469]SDG44381.1 ABC-2 family transporter protein [Marvinbryantia formatexigens]